MPEIVCILNNKRSKPPALAENKKKLIINKHGNIALFKILSFQIQNIRILKTIIFLLHNKTFKDLGVLGHLCK